MALHENLSELADEAINEYLQTSDMCLNYRKENGGRLGYPSTLLLFCVTNALGTYLVGESVVIDGRTQRITPGEPFRVMNHGYFGLQLSHAEIKRVEKSYRNRLAHNAIIDPDSFLIDSGEDPPFVFKGSQVAIRILSFHRCVSKAWEHFPKDRITAWERQTRHRRA